MPGLGMHMGQRQEMRQVQALVQQQVQMDPGNGVAQFRTDEEKKIVSQYEILKQLAEVLTKGEYFDQEHFGLEINRAIFGNPLEARLGNFGRDIGSLIDFYGGKEAFAQHAITLLAAQKEDGERKDIPGKIASSWYSLSSSEQLPHEKRNKKVLTLIDNLREKDADIASGLDIVAQAAHLPDQKDLVGASMEKVEGYANQDVRMIPFAHSVLSPVLRAVGYRKETLSESDAKAIYDRVVDSLFMLDRDLRVKSSVDNISQAIREYGVAGLLSQTNIPLPLQVALERVTDKEDIRNRIVGLCSDNEISQGRELQRKIYRGLSSLEDLTQPGEAIEHISQYVEGSKGLARVLGAVSLVAHDPDFIYPYELQDEKEILRNLRLQLTDKSIKRLGLDDATLETYVERLESDERFEEIGKIVTTLAGYSHYQNSEQTGLLREIVSEEIKGTFPTWRYGHDKSENQLAVLEGKIESWKENKRVSRLVGELDALESHINSIKHTTPKLLEAYGEHYQDDSSANALRQRVTDNEEALRAGSLETSQRKQIGFETSQLREQLQYRELLEGIETLTTENYGPLLEQADKLARKRSKNPLYHNAVWIRDTLDQPAYRDARRVSVIETDNLDDLLRMGEIPVPHCQDWRSDSTLNESLPSFVADANKKLYHITNGNNKPFGMSLVRLLDWHNEPTLLIENIYSNEWSTDYGVALVGSLADKAAAISKETGKRVRLAAPYHSGHDAHGTNVQVKKAFERFSEQYNVYINEGTINTNLPESKSTYEYVDCGPGKIKSGSQINVDVSYLTFGEE